MRQFGHASGHTIATGRILPKRSAFTARAPVLACAILVWACAMSSAHPAAAESEVGTALTFRDEQGQLVHQHLRPLGCYNVPEPGWVIADLDGRAHLIDGLDCLGDRAIEIDRPTPVVPGQSVLVEY